MNINASNLNELLLKAYNKYLEESPYDDDPEPVFNQEILTEGAYYIGKTGVEVDGYEIGVAADVGGGEGDGETRYIVYKVSDGTDTKYFRYDGYYASWEGSNFDDLESREVKAREKVVVVFD